MNNTVNKQDTLNKLLNGVNTLANVVKTTSGSKGHTILIEKKDHEGNIIPYITKDGVTVANSIVCSDSIENLGCKLLQEAAKLTVEQAGDGTTGTCIMAQSLIQNIINLDVQDHRKLFQDIENVTENILSQLKKQIKKVKTKKDAIRIASISTNSESLGNLVGTVMWDARINGVVHFEISDTSETYIYKESGSYFDKRYDLKQFLGATGTKVVYDNPIVLVYQNDVVSYEDLVPYLEMSKEEDRALVIIAPSFSKMIIQIFEMNVVKNSFKILPLYVPAYGEEQPEIIKDIQALTHENVERVMASRNGFTIFTKEVTPLLQERIDNLAYLSTMERTPYYKDKIDKRISTLSQKVFTIYAGAKSELERNELKDRIEDGLLATRAAIENGYVLGGGLALYNIATSLPSEGYANQIMYDVITSPMMQILENAQVESITYIKLIHDQMGFNTTTMRIEDFYKSGIIDPYKVIACSLTNAVSVAKTIISLNGAIQHA